MNDPVVNPSADARAGTVSRRASLARRARHEFEEYLVVSVYLYICFATVLFYKAAILRGEGIDFEHYGLAAGKALILGKFVLLGHALKLGTRATPGRAALDIAYKAVTFTVLLVVLNVVEEIVLGAIHGRAVATVLADFGGDKLPRTLATSLLLLLIMLPYFGFRELSRRLPPGTVRRLLLERPDPASSGGD